MKKFIFILVAVLNSLFVQAVYAMYQPLDSQSEQPSTCQQDPIIPPFAVYQPLESQSEQPSTYQQDPTVPPFAVYSPFNNTNQRRQSASPKSSSKRIRGYYISNNSLQAIKLDVSETERGIVVNGYYDPQSGQLVTVKSYAKDVTKFDGELYDYFNYKVYTQYRYGWLYF